MILIGEAFVAVDEDEATAYVEKKQKVSIRRTVRIEDSRRHRSVASQALSCGICT
jgi:hypothetical protein